MEQTMPINTERMSEEEKRKSLLDLWKMIKENFRKMVSKLFLKKEDGNFITSRLEEIENDMEELLASDDMTEEALQELYAITSDVVGKLDTITAENAKEIIDDFKNKTDKLLQDTVKASDGKVEKTFIEGIQEVIEKETNKKLGKDFYNDFCNKARVITTMKDDEFFVEFNGIVLKMDYEIKKAEKSNTIIYNPKFVERSEIFAENGILKPPYINARNVDGNAMHILNSAVSKGNGLEYVLNKEEELKRIERMLSPKGLFLAGVKDKVVTSSDGRYQRTYISADATYRVRDTETGDMFVISNTDKDINFTLYSDTKDMNINGRGTAYGGWEEKDGHIISKLLPIKGSVEINNMLRSEAISEWLELNGIDKDKQNKAFIAKGDTNMQKVDNKNFHKVKNLEGKLQHMISKLDDSYSVTLSHGYKLKHTFLTVSNENGDKFSYAFKKNGEVQAINFRKAGEEKYKFMINVDTKTTSPEYGNYKKDRDFNKLMAMAREGVGIDNKKITKRKLTNKRVNQTEITKGIYNE